MSKHTVSKHTVITWPSPEHRRNALLTMDETRRPGVRLIALAVLDEHPNWSLLAIQAEAKKRYVKNIRQTH